MFLGYILAGWSRTQCEQSFERDPVRDPRLRANFDDADIDKHVTSIDCTWFSLDDGRCVAFDTSRGDWQRCRIHLDDE